jgi:hypothetical protein
MRLSKGIKRRTTNSKSCIGMVTKYSNGHLKMRQHPLNEKCFGGGACGNLLGAVKRQAAIGGTEASSIPHQYQNGNIGKI